MMRRINSQLGYTLLQLLLALEISTVTAAVATPKVFSFYGQYQLKSISGQISFDIMRARMQAIGQNKYVRIRSTSTTTYVRESSDNASTWTTDTTRTMPKGLTLTTTNAEVRFDKRGFASPRNDVGLTNSSSSKTISTNSIGRVTVSNG